MTQLLVVGAGPTGLTAAAEALRHGLTVRIIDSNSHRSVHSKALVLHSRTLEIFTDMGFVDQVLAAGKEFRALNMSIDGKPLSRIDFRAIDWQDAIYPFWLSLPQSETERLLEEHLGRLGVTVERRTKLTGLDQQGDRVRATLTTVDAEGELIGEEQVDVPWLIGCDGARSATRKLSDIEFEGTAEDELFILGDVSIDWDQPEDEGHNFMSSDGILLVVPLPQSKRFRIIAHMPALSGDNSPEITLDLLQNLMDQRTGVSSKISDLVWQSNFTVKHLVAKQHQLGRIFLAGDAAHIHSPVGGQGLNTGIQDSYNLLWKLALVHAGKGTEALLESYQIERHEVAESTIKKVSLATNVVTLKNPISRTLRNQLASLVINTDAVQNRMGRDVGMLDISYAKSQIIQDDTPEAGLTQKLLKSFGDGGNQFNAGPRSGERAPNVLFLDPKGTPNSLVDSFYGVKHTLLLFAGQSDKSPSAELLRLKRWLDEQHTATIKPILLMTSELPDDVKWDGAVLINSDAAVHRRYGATAETVYLVRPDHHIGYRTQSTELEVFQAYVGQILLGSSK